jgi:ERCC4-related helicase
VATHICDHIAFSKRLDRMHASTFCLSCNKVLSQFSCKQVILEEKVRFGQGLRCIVFVQQRVTTHILENFINNDPDLGCLPTAAIYATSSPATPKLRVRPADAAARLKLFAEGHVMVLLATSVAEEGMDVPAANCVIRFDEVQTPVSLVQSRGRARQANSSFVLMKVRILWF